MSNPQWPIYTFKVNLPTLQRYSSSLPNRTTLDGNETVTEEDALRATRTTWLASMFPGCNFVAQHKPTSEDGFLFTAYGKQAVYMKSLYCSTPPNPLVDVLLIVPTPNPDTTAQMAQG